MIYGESWAREQVVSRATAIREYVRHGLDAGELDRDLGVYVTYDGADVLDALGY